MDTSEQGKAWAGDFGNDYHRRSPGNAGANLEFFQRIFEGEPMPPIRTILELGAGTGANVWALKKRFPRAEITAVEVNRPACVMMQSDIPGAEVINASLLDWRPAQQWDLVLTKGVLIHIHPARLLEAYHTIYSAASRYVLMAEYYNPKPVDVEYRGMKGLLWKRDFAGEFLDKFPAFELVDYGFAYHRDPVCPQDDLNWFLLERRS